MDGAGPARFPPLPLGSRLCKWTNAGLEFMLLYDLKTPATAGFPCCLWPPGLQVDGPPSRLEGFGTTRKGLPDSRMRCSPIGMSGEGQIAGTSFAGTSIATQDANHAFLISNRAQPKTFLFPAPYLSYFARIRVFPNSTVLCTVLRARAQNKGEPVPCSLDFQSPHHARESRPAQRQTRRLPGNPRARRFSLERAPSKTRIGLSFRRSRLAVPARREAVKTGRCPSMP